MRSWCVNCPNWYPIERKKKEVGRAAILICLTAAFQYISLLPGYYVPFWGVLSCSSNLLMGLVWPWLDIKELQILFGNGHFVSSYHVILDFEEKVSQPFFSLLYLLRAKLWTAMNLDSQMNCSRVVLRFLLYLHSMLSLRNNGIRSTKKREVVIDRRWSVRKRRKKPLELY